jgi:hypothetical protein
MNGRLCSFHAGTEENLDYCGVCGALRYLGFDLSRHPFRDRNDSAVFDGRDALFSRRRDHVRNCSLAGRSKIDMGGVADGVDRRRVFASRRQRRCNRV